MTVPTPLPPGTRLGSYEITAALGAGGMGEVYRARDVRLERDVAIKLLTGGQDDGAERLLREARNASALNHPNICTLHEINESGPRPFIVMELVDGEPLDRRLTAGSGIVHRDLKSANVVITADGRPKILDFGIAKRMATADLAAATVSIKTLTADQEIAGTLPYMAPEVLEGRPADARSDLWALGVMLAEMASGSRPFAGNTAVALSTAIMRDEPRIPAEVPAPLGDVIRTLLAKEPSRRYQSASEVSTALQRISMGGVAPGSKAPGFRVAVAVLTAVAIITGAGAWWWFTGRAAGDVAPGNRIRSVAVLPLQNLSNAEEQQYFADGMTEALISDLSAIGELRVISRTSVMQFKNTTRSLSDIAEALTVDAIIEGAVLRTDTRIRITARLIDARTQGQLWSGVYEKPISDAIELQREIASTIGREIRGELAPADTARLARRTSVDPEAYQSYLRGRFQWNLRSFANLQQAVKLFQDAIARDPGFALAYAGLADVYVVLGDYRDVLPAEAYGRAREAADTALRLDPSLAEAHTARAWLAMSLERDWAAAEASFQRALQLNPGYATAHQWHGEFLAALGRFEEALAAMQRAQDLDPLAPMPQAIHGWMALLAGRYDEAIKLCEGVLARDPTFRPARMYRAWTYMETGRLDEAEREAKALLDMASSPAVPLATLGRIRARRGDRAGALSVIEKLRALPYPPSFDIAKLHAELRNREETLTWLAKAESERSSAVLYIKSDASFAWLRNDPGFIALLGQLHLR
ncbi:MAG TPA: protein kinase [Vicinamibacterales bacterium]|nr:protein kinase [Vicinamibacterales bacterium]